MTAQGGFESVLDYLSGEIMHGRVAPGTRLPNERELAARLGASRSAVREAIKVLHAQGVVTTHPGATGGTRVASHPGDAFGRMLKLHVALDTISMRELTQTRMVLERAAAEVAATRRDDEGLAELDHLLTLQQSWATAQAFHDLDTAFHLAVARMGDNRLVRDLTIAIREAVASHILAAENIAPDWERLRPRLVEEHRGIVAAIRLGDADAAGRLAADHVRSSHSALRLLD
ncbi:FadR family transcriptional regulator [Propioniciclava coleopterorum]|uniref:FadR family transcriptional regulator n=1 Tax=Propioniciclava coleopterorum TaxID=2714937 RepID=A0A6G7Y5G0_9ACTN|nr:FCD domain-containing protein [Propioniciclava coleopterorum]QIK71949.1 FadR family transcriptional regulator [Propioniciclava coleopterorum]